ncbi:hypothetical protein ACQP1V_36395 [Microtetraspora malaysiensis]|uniref:hypothetical protein n=1 Tax=Microtetraspora malaysiensis TaxID=161358 RepID=UPI003D92A7ED
MTIPEHLTPEQRDELLASMTDLECRLALCALATGWPAAFDVAAAAVERDRAHARPRTTRGGR